MNAPTATPNGFEDYPTAPDSDSDESSNGSISTSGSFEAYLQTRRAELQERKQHEIEVPGYKNLVGVYHNLDYKTLRNIAHRHERQDETTAEIYGAADLLINACDRIYGRGDDGTIAELGVWGVALASKFGIDSPDIDTSRKALLAIFQSQEMNLVTHAGELVQAMQNADSDVDAELEEDLGAAG